MAVCSRNAEEPGPFLLLFQRFPFEIPAVMARNAATGQQIQPKGLGQARPYSCDTSPWAMPQSLSTTTTKERQIQFSPQHLQGWWLHHHAGQTVAMSTLSMRKWCHRSHHFSVFHILKYLNLSL